MSTPDGLAPVAIDYTSRDFYGLREDLIERVRSKVQGWFGNDPADFGVALVEAFAYVGDVLGYYTDRIANETSLLTATQRASVLALARSAGYLPSGYESSVCTVRISNSDTSNIVVPAGTQFAGSYSAGDVTENVIFTLIDELTVPAGGNASGLSFHGENVSLRYPSSGAPDVAGEPLGTSTGRPGQRFYLSETTVVTSSIRVFVQYGNSYGSWTAVPYLSDSGPNDPVYSVEVDADNRVSIVFGDGVSGAIPTAFSAIKAQYVVGGGVRGNIPINSLYSLYRVPGLTDSEVAALSEVLTVTNTDVGTGGRDPDDLNLIRTIATQTVRANDRAVTLRDYSSLALQASDVSKVNSLGATFSSVTVFVAPTRTTTLGDPYPLYDDTNTSLTLEWSGLQQSVQETLNSRRPVGVTVTVSPPTYVDVTCSVLYNLSPQYTASEVTAALQARLLEAFSYNNVSFGQVIYPEQVEAALREVPGADNIRVTELFKTDDLSNTRDILVGQPGELFIFKPSEITIAAASSQAEVSTLAFSTGTLSPTFDPEFFNYTLTVGTGVTSVNITATISAGATFTIGGSAATSGIATSVSTPTASTSVPIVVVAENGVTRNTYSLIIVKV